MSAPLVPPKAVGVRSDRSNRAASPALTTASASCLVVGSAYDAVSRFLFADRYPPFLAQTAAASGEARYSSSACAPLLSLNATAWSPATTTDGGEPFTDGKSKNFALSPTFRLPALAISPATKSPSNSMTAFGLSPNTSATDWVKVSWSAPVGPPSMAFGVFHRVPRIVSVSTTDWSVQGRPWVASLSYLSAPATRR